MDTDITKIRKHVGQIYLSDTILTILEILNPSKLQHKKQVSRMIKEIISIRNYECVVADALHGKLDTIDKNSDGCDCLFVDDGFCPNITPGAVCERKK